MSTILFNLSARCDKAGRSVNQDNCWVCLDVGKINEMPCYNKDEDFTLPHLGTILLVADGMGGMSAGDKASKIVVYTIKDFFSHIPMSVLTSDEVVQSFIKETIVEADRRIKKHAIAHPEDKGLGSTVAMVWFLNNKAYCGWCGDSRIYRFNPNNSLVRLSHDHSFVQELVDKGALKKEDAFNHPDSNIITRSLGDCGEIANPETFVYDVQERDIYLLCSDGLCGLLQDSEIEDILSKHSTSPRDALVALWDAGTIAGWTDNVTIELLCIQRGGKIPKGVAVGYPEPVVKFNPKLSSPNDSLANQGPIQNKHNLLVYWCAGLLALILVVVAIFIFCHSKDTNVPTPEDSENTSNTVVVSIEANNVKERETLGQFASDQEQMVKPKPVKQPKINQQPEKKPIEEDKNTNQLTIVGQDSIKGTSPNTPKIIEEQLTEPSMDFLEGMSRVREDYVRICNVIWPKAQELKAISTENREFLRRFITNVRNLKKDPSYKCLDEQRLQEYAQWSELANIIDPKLPYLKDYQEQTTPTNTKTDSTNNTINETIQ